MAISYAKSGVGHGHEHDRDLANLAFVAETYAENLDRNNSRFNSGTTTGAVPHDFADIFK